MISKKEGIDVRELAMVDKIIDESLRKGFPGGQLLIEIAGKKIYERSFGSVVLENCSLTEEAGFNFERGPMVTASTLFDIASLTKIFATTYLFQKYIEEEPALLTRTLADFFPALLKRHEECINASVGTISLKALLSHHAGFEPNPLFYDPTYSASLYCQNRENFPEALLKAPLINPVGSVGLYSDVDFMLLTYVLEKIGGEGLEAQLQRHFWVPLGLTDIMYRPLAKGLSKDQLAATERAGNTRDGLYDYPNIRTEMIQGEVQDEKAYYCLEEVSGHAGLFSNARTLSKLFKLMTTPNEIFSEAIKAQFLSPHFSEKTFGLGWRLNGPDMGYMFGKNAGKDAFGHTGWTGCLATHDPTNQLTIIYLTNRKNTPVCDPAENPHLFYGDQLPAGRYRPIIQAIYHDLGIHA